MNVCRNCGKEYEGKYCPECGTRYDRRPVRCKNCGCEFVGRFCPECGERYEPAGVCPRCGAEVTSRFCPDCGTRYDPYSQQAAKVSSNAAMPGSFVDAGTYGDVSMPGAGEKRVCQVCGTTVEGRYCPVCGSEYGAKRICRKCGKAYVGSFCPNCGERDTSRETGSKVYQGISRSICALVLTFAVLFVISCTALPWQTETNRYGTTYLNGLLDMYEMIELIPVWLFVYSIAVALVCIPYSAVGLKYGAKKNGRRSMYQTVGAVGIALMTVAIAYSIIVCMLMIGSDYRPASGAICALVFTSSFLVATSVLFRLSMSYPKKNPSYTDALKNEREKLAQSRAKSDEK